MIPKARQFLIGLSPLEAAVLIIGIAAVFVFPPWLFFACTAVFCSFMVRFGHIVKASQRKTVAAVAMVAAVLALGLGIRAITAPTDAELIQNGFANINERFAVLMAAQGIPAVEDAVQGVREAVLDFINTVRATNDVPGFAHSSGLERYAQDVAMRIADDQSLFHSDLSDLLESFLTAGELIGFGPKWEDVMAAMVESPGHLGFITAAASQAGVGVELDDAGVMWVAVVFGTPE